MPVPVINRERERDKYAAFYGSLFLIVCALIPSPPLSSPFEFFFYLLSFHVGGVRLSLELEPKLLHGEGPIQRQG